MRKDGEGGPGKFRKGEPAVTFHTMNARIPSSAYANVREPSNPMVQRTTAPGRGSCQSYIHRAWRRLCATLPGAQRLRSSIAVSIMNRIGSIGGRTAYKPRKWVRSNLDEKSGGHLVTSRHMIRFSHTCERSTWPTACCSVLNK